MGSIELERAINLIWVFCAEKAYKNIFYATDIVCGLIQKQSVP